MRKKILLSLAGYIALTLGAIGVILPLLPTTPFVLLASLCFTQANPKIAQALRKNRILGPYLEHWYAGAGVPLSYKIKVVAFTWLGLGYSIYVVETFWVQTLLVFIGLAVSGHIFLLKNARKSKRRALHVKE